VRLGKFWLKALYLGPKRIYGIKTVLELIAVSAGINEMKESEEKNENPSLYYAFCDFLLEVSQINDLQLAFQKIRGTKNWERIMPNGYSDDDDDDYQDNDDEESDEERYIIDPSNSKNDLMKNFRNREPEIRKLKEFAKTTKNKMEVQSVTRITSIFRPQPKLFKVMDQMSVKRPTRFRCDPDYEYNSFFCHMQINNPPIFSDKGKKS